MKYSIRGIKEAQLKLFKELLEQVLEDEGDTKAISYLTATIKTLKKDLEATFHPATVKSINDPNDKITEILTKVGLSPLEAKMFALLIANDEVIASECLGVINERGKVYRTLDSLIKLQLVVKIPSQVSAFAVLDKENVLGGMILKLKEDIKVRQQVNKTVMELIK